MKQRPILFNGAMVRAILSGQKTQTRRIVKPHGWTIDQMSKYEFAHVLQATETDGLTVKKPAAEAYAGFKLSPDAASPAYFKFPFGTIGDQIWVRECHSILESSDSGNAAPVWYWVDGDPPEGDYTKPRPSIHMPRAASRITLEITSIRVERLQSISEEDAIAEGAIGGHGLIPNYQYAATPLEHFKHIWESTGGDWNANPWVWCLNFKRVEQ